MSNPLLFRAPSTVAMLALGACTLTATPSPRPPEPTYVQSASAPAPAPAPAPPADVVYDQPPVAPPPLQEAPPPTPGPEFVWVAGNQRWDGRGYVWEHGRYERRPHARANWRQGHWEPRGRGHVWVGAHWD